MSDETEFEEHKIFQAAKRCGIQRCPWMDEGDWFTSWSPRNDNTNAEGEWHHWCNLAAFILSHPATKAVAPALYRPDLLVNKSMYTECNQLNAEQIKKFFCEETTEGQNP